ncbi:PARP-domain-containing protein [Cutaneotrichosporon oleaginosum]|uniref:Poly [ADP-ribose] polymerase n=1 Tax=Cutaneotrichosporon oleaginosum TaxID=879819 RepID=A0A0J0XBC0_9TREE|nr:PARP-domain-containing protein [Cutaneotrichosporon oleaginosum]KLT38345.1 PARP-domain-containing protein [Cutaneotrichosporon oleaginosum]TXT09635.1 hypothetical protein COLE_03569 [Cutaneotrichosporon oleaginosum]
MRLGAKVSNNVTKTVTHLIANTADIQSGSPKITAAKKNNVHILDERWVEACEEEGDLVDEAKYVALAASVNGAANGTANGHSGANGAANGKKRAAESDDEEDVKPAKRGKKAAPASAKPAPPSPSKAAGAITSTKLQDTADKVASKGDLDGQKAKKTKGFNVPVDEYCHLVNYKVYIDDDGMIYDANLNQTNAGNNNNKFYRVQILYNGGNYRTWTRWGRVGEAGQNKLLGCGTLPDAIANFNQKFKDKSGLNWAQRNDPPKPKKYTFIEKSYDDDSDNEGADNDVKEEEDEEEEWVPPESKLEQPIQDLMALIFNTKYMNNAMRDLNYDAQKMPLGKLSKSTILKGFQALKDLASLFDDHSLAQSVHGQAYQSAVEMLSNRFYSYIPHDFGRNRPPIIASEALLKREIELLESLGDMKEAAAIMKAERPKDTMHAYDRQFNSLGMEEMTVLDKASKEFKELAAYLVDSKGATHHVNYQVEEIFRIERAGETKRFDESIYPTIPSDRRLLWHGSRATNFGGILSQGLRIAPPEAPVSGYMFGKGIYLADMSSKSVNYCCSYLSDSTALLLLCEAELGDPLQKLTNASYNAGDSAKAGGMYSTWGQGRVGPSKWKCAGEAHESLKGIKMPDVTTPPGDTNVDGAYLMYNEYITYDVNQVKLRYLFRVKT